MSRILIANDNPDLLELYQAVLEDAGYDVRGVADGRAAVEIARRWLPDAAVFDFVMPHMSGADAAEHLRADPVTARIPLLMISASSAAPEATRVGADDFLAKPFSPEDLVTRLGALLATGRRSTG
jgi:two-component system response regulator MtrA